MGKNILTNTERLELVEKYKTDKLNAPPANIKDETLISHYGTEEQQNRLAVEAAKPAPKATENKAAAAAATTENPAPNESAVPSPEQDGDLTEAAPQEGNAPQVAPTVEKVIEPAPAPSQASKDAAYVDAFNDYIDLFQKMPSDNLSAEALVKANEKKRAELAELEVAKLAAANAPKPAPVNNNVTLVNIATKENITVSRTTWEKFIIKDGTHKLKAAKPKELD